MGVSVVVVLTGISEVLLVVLVGVSLVGVFTVPVLLVPV